LTPTADFVFRKNYWYWAQVEALKRSHDNHSGSGQGPVGLTMAIKFGQQVPGWILLKIF